MGEYVDLAYERRLRLYPRREAAPPTPPRDPRDARIAALERQVEFLGWKLIETNRLVLRLVYAQSSGRGFAQGMAHTQGDGEGQEKTGA